jgi:phage protein U
VATQLPSPMRWNMATTHTRSHSINVGSSAGGWARASSQFVGPGEDAAQLSGLIALPLNGQYSSLATLQETTETGQPWALVVGHGTVLGA